MWATTDDANKDHRSRRRRDRTDDEAWRNGLPDGWDDAMERKLCAALSRLKTKFILSTWHHNDFRRNEYIETLWSEFDVLTKDHFYHVGGKETNRNPVVEALITNFTVTAPVENTRASEQLALLDL